MTCTACGKEVAQGEEIRADGEVWCRTCRGKVDPHNSSSTGRVTAAVQDWKSRNGY